MKPSPRKPPSRRRRSPTTSTCGRSSASIASVATTRTRRRATCRWLRSPARCRVARPERSSRAGDPDSSRLWALVSHAEEPKMPPNQDKLPAAKLDMIKGLDRRRSAGEQRLGGQDEKATGSRSEPDSRLGQARAGPPPMPEGLSRQPAVYTPRAAAVTALACQSLGAAGGGGRTEADRAVQHRQRHSCSACCRFPRAFRTCSSSAAAARCCWPAAASAARSGSVVVFDVKTGKRVFEVGDELDVVLAADINEDHTRIALGGPGRVVRIFSTADGSLVHEIRKHTEWIYALEFSPDGVLLATADRSRRHVRVGSRDGPRVSESGRSQGGDHRRELAGRFERAGQFERRRHDQAVGNGRGQGDQELGRACRRRQLGRVCPRRKAGVGRPRSARPRSGTATARRFASWPRLGDLAMEVAFTHDAARVVAGDWLGEVRLSDVADGKQVALLAPNPPTLEMLVQAQTAAAAAAVALRKKRPPNRRLRSPSRKRRLPTRPRQRPRRKRLPPTWRLPKRSWSKRPRPAKRQPTPLRPRKPACRACWPKRPPSRNRSRRKPPSRSKRCAKST